MAKIYDFTKRMNGAKTLEELHKELAPDMSVDEFKELAYRANIINKDGTPTQWAIDKGYVVHVTDEKYLQLIELSERFCVSTDDLSFLIRNGDLSWNDEEKEWFLSKQGITDIGFLTTNKHVQEMVTKFITSAAM